MNTLNANDFLEFPLMSIRRCGHSKDHFFIELGRSSVIGAGEIYMATEGTLIAQNMHETVLSAMKSSKIREDGNSLPRPCSASTSENYNTVPTRRPITPQSISSLSNSGLSNSRERCDSLPNRPQAIAGNTHCSVLGALSSPYTSCGSSFQKISSRPHSMYEWPSLSSPSTRNTCFSPSSLSETACSSSTEDIDNMKYQALGYSRLESTNSKKSLNQRISELSEEYLKMSITNDSTLGAIGAENINSKELVTRLTDYMDMKSVASPLNESVKPGKVSLVSNSSISNGISVNEGYFDMSPSNSLSKDTHCIRPFYKEGDLTSIFKGSKDETNNVDGPKQHTVNRSSVPKQEFISKSPTNFKCIPSQFVNVKLSEEQPSVNKNAFVGAQLSLSDQTLFKNENKANNDSPALIQTFENVNQLDKNMETSASLKYHDLSMDFADRNIELEDQDVFYNESDSVKSVNIVSPCQNTNFSCLQNDARYNSHSLACVHICSKTFSPSFNTNVCKHEVNESNKTYFDQNTNNMPSSNCMCDNSEVRLPFDTQIPTFPKTDWSADGSTSNDQNSNFPPITEHVCEGDYANVDIKSKPLLPNQQKTSYVMPKPRSLLPPCSETNDPNYSNIQFGKPFCPLPKPTPATSVAMNHCLKTDWPFTFPNHPRLGEEAQVTRPSQADKGSPKCAVVAPMLRNIPNTLPAFRKQMSAPAAPPSLRQELPSPGRKSSCPVTASTSMVRPPPCGTSTCTGTLADNRLKVSTSRSPDHSSVSSVSSASDEISSAHSSPQTLSQTVPYRQVGTEITYENVVIPLRSSTSSRPASTSSDEKELVYAMLELGPPTSEIVPRSPTVKRPADDEEASTYAQIDFTKSEGLKNTSGNMRGRS